MVLTHLERLADQNGAYGSYRAGLGRRPDLYSSLDAAIMRTIMGEDLRQTLSDEQRRQWCEHINSFAVHHFHRPREGSYCDTLGHSPLHANGMVVGALGAIGGKQKYPCRLYDGFDTPDKVAPWLEREIDWTAPWSESHLFWGGLHCFSFSSRCTPQWLGVTFAWLDAHVDPATGWWRRGVAPRSAFEPLGGAVHILPIYPHHGRVFPYPRQMIDSTLALQLSTGRWHPKSDRVLDYLELDALYVLALLGAQEPDYRRDDILAAVGRYGQVVRSYLEDRRDHYLSQHPHYLLAGVGVMGLLHQLLPDEFVDDAAWTDIFSDRRLYQTSEVEIF